jgi:hypothetical protein
LLAAQTVRVIASSLMVLGAVVGGIHWFRLLRKTNAAGLIDPVPSPDPKNYGRLFGHRPWIAVLLGLGLIACLAMLAAQPSTSSLGSGVSSTLRSFGIVGCVMILLVALFAPALRGRSRELRTVASGLGLRFAGRDREDLGSPRLPLLVATRERMLAGDNRRVENVMTGTRGGREFGVFEFWYTRGAGDTGRGGPLDPQRSMTCALVGAPIDAPPLAVTPRTQGFAAVPGVPGGEAVGSESEAFDRAFRVTSSDPRFASAALDARVMAWMLDDEAGAWGYQAQGSWLLVFGSRRPPSEVPGVLERAIAFADRLPHVVGDLFPPPAADAGAQPGGLSPNRSPAQRVRSWHTSGVDDEELLARAEQALTEIKVGQGLSERHAAVLAALRIRLKGSAGKSLEEMLAAADDEPGSGGLDEKIAEVEAEPKRSLDDLFVQDPKPKPDWPS